MNPPAPVTSALRSGNNRLDRVDGAAERSQDSGSFHRRLNGFANARDDIRCEDRDEIRVLPRTTRPPAAATHPSSDSRCVRLLLVLTMIRRHPFNHFQRRVVPVRLQNDDLIRKPACLPDDICRIVVMVQNGLYGTRSKALSSNGSEWPSPT